MSYRIRFEAKAKKQLDKIDHTQRRIIISWIQKNLENTDQPRKYGKALKGNLGEYWSYRIGKYRILAEIKDQELVIIVIGIAHRRDAYG